MSRRLWITTAMLGAALGLTACGSDDGRADAGHLPSSEDVGSVDDERAPGVPPECAEPFPLAYGPATLSDVELLPDGWPEAPAGSTLCMTMDTVGGSQETASYATTLSDQEVLEAWESALADSFTVARETDGLGAAILTGAGGGTSFQITPRAGGYTVVFIDEPV